MGCLQQCTKLFPYTPPSIPPKTAGPSARKGELMIDINKITRQCIIDIKEYVPGKPIEEVKRELGLDDVIKLSSNENPLGTSPMALQAMIKEIKENVHYYPEAVSYTHLRAHETRHDLV